MSRRLSLSQRLGLLLGLPLCGVLATGVPFVAGRSDDARAAAAVLTAATEARGVGNLVHAIQQERLLALGYLLSPRVDRQALQTAEAAVDDIAAGLDTDLGAADPGLPRALSAARADLLVRIPVLRRTVGAAQVYDAYHSAVVSLVGAVRLTSRTGLDALGTRWMAALDALLRSDEEAAQTGAALIMATTDPMGAAASARLSTEREQLYLDSFRSQADAANVALFDAIATGPTAARTAVLVVRVLGRNAAEPADPAPLLSIDDALSAAQAGIDLRRVVQDRIAEDLSARAGGDASSARAAEVTGFALTAGLLIFIVGMGVTVSRGVSVPLRRLTSAAITVADLASRELVRVGDADVDDESPPRLAAVNLRTDDEIGELASAFNRVQATAALLMEQQVTTRRNVSIMFSNIAHRTRGLVARQLTQIDELERDERDDARLARLYQLDHVSMRLRRSAASLLVIAGNRGQQPAVATAPLPDVVRSAVAEVESYRNIRVGHVPAVTVAAVLVSDLTLLLAELLENATAFSPPDSPVEVSADLVGTVCTVRVVDRGIGMAAARLDEENRRLHERERLDLAPTAMLGLFVVGRIARRHRLGVELRPTPSTGITAFVSIPADHLVSGGDGWHDDAARGGDTPVPSAPLPATAYRPARPLALPGGNGYPAHVAPTAVAPSARPAGPPEPAEQRSGLRRRSRAEADAPAPDDRMEVGAPGRVARDAEADRAAFGSFQHGLARAVARDGSPAPGPPGPLAGEPVTQSLPQRRPAGAAPHEPAGRTPRRAATPAPVEARALVRRTPGAHLAAELQGDGYPAPARWSSWFQPPTVVRPARPPRDADSERSAFADYAAGLARAAAIPTRQDRSAK